MSSGEGSVKPLGEAAQGAKQAIAELIDAGVFRPGDKLPGERELAERVSVSRTVLRDALAALAAEGRLESSPWRGWFVTSVHMAEQVALRSFTSMARERGLVPGARVMRQQVRAASFEECGQLRLAPGAQVLELHRLRTLDGRPACYDVSVISVDRADGIVEADFEDASMYDRLEETAGVRIVRSDYAVRAEAVDQPIADHLALAEGDPVLVGEEVAADLSGTPILMGRVVYRSDAYEFHATLFRPFERTRP